MEPVPLCSYRQRKRQQPERTSEAGSGCRFRLPFLGEVRSAALVNRSNLMERRAGSGVRPWARCNEREQQRGYGKAESKEQTGVLSSRVREWLKFAFCRLAFSQGKTIAPIANCLIESKQGLFFAVIFAFVPKHFLDFWDKVLSRVKRGREARDCEGIFSEQGNNRVSKSAGGIVI